MTVNQEEIFGPVASVNRVHDLDEALAVANQVPFGGRKSSSYRPRGQGCYAP